MCGQDDEVINWGTIEEEWMDKIDEMQRFY